MVRAKKFIDIVRTHNLAENTAERGCQVVGLLQKLAAEHSEISNVRGMGSWVAFTLPSSAARDAMLGSMMDNELLALASGPQSIRLRMPLILSEEEGNQVGERIAASVPSLTGA